MQRLPSRLAFGIGVPVLVVAVLLASWAIDASRLDGKVPRNTVLAGEDVGGMNKDQLSAAVTALAKRYEGLKVRVETGAGKSFEVTTGDLGLRLDQDATRKAALDLDKFTSPAGRPVAWLTSFADPRTTDLKFTVDNEALTATMTLLAGDSTAKEPEIVNGTTGLAVINGTPGTWINADGVREQLLSKARSGDTPIVVKATREEAPPRLSDAVAQDFVNRINATTANGITVAAGTYEVVVDAETVRSWLGTTIDGDKITLTLDKDAANKTISAAVDAKIPGDVEPRDAKIALVNGAPQITPSTTGEKCCGDDTGQKVLDAINKNTNRVEVKLEVAEPKLTTEAAEKLGIKEPVGSITTWAGQPQVKSFTTYYQAGQPRAVNIHKIADDVQGVVILPGEQFSMNGIVGQRTAAKGYVAAGAIRDGEHVDEIGGGVSQFATTMFNAAYFAGLQIDTYQAHSEHFSRYPRGREATMGFPAPDLAWTNNTPYGILVQTSYTPTSVTVTLWSTQWATAEQTGSSDSRAGRCTVVTTTRTVTYADGKTKNDQFQARYRDAGATTC